MIENLTACFDGLVDPRATRRCDHQLIDILVIAALGAGPVGPAHPTHEGAPPHDPVAYRRRRKAGVTHEIRDSSSAT